jgi:hypothetical protein
MAEDRMLNDEILLGLIKANSGGGGGGTTNYNLLENKPQIGGVELQGNKSLADLGIASADDVKNEFIGTLAEWNALSPAQQKAFDTYQITDDYFEALMPNYSTTEQKTGQKWIDGRDVYIRTFDFSSSPVAVAFNSWTSLGVNIPKCDILLKCNATQGVTNLSASGIEFEIKKSENYGLYAEYNQNTNIRRISYLICEYVKGEVS